jgi:hypothetical protein
VRSRAAARLDLGRHQRRLHDRLHRRHDRRDQDWLHELSIDLFPEDGCLRLYGVGRDGVVAFTRDGIECLKQIIADKRASGSALPELKSPE